MVHLPHQKRMSPHRLTPFSADLQHARLVSYKYDLARRYNDFIHLYWLIGAQIAGRRFFWHMNLIMLLLVVKIACHCI